MNDVRQTRATGVVYSMTQTVETAPTMGDGYVLGLDIGRVIIGGESREDTQSLWGDDYLNTPEIDGAISTICSLTGSGLWKATHLVSKAGPQTEERTRQWLVHHEFYKRTGVPEGNVHFTVTRSGKRPIAERLGLTHFVDDRAENLMYMLGSAVRTLILFGDQQENLSPEGIVTARNWSETKAALIGSLEQ